MKIDYRPKSSSSHLQMKQFQKLIELYKLNSVHSTTNTNKFTEEYVSLKLENIPADVSLLEIRPHTNCLSIQLICFFEARFVGSN